MSAAPMSAAPLSVAETSTASMSTAVWSQVDVFNPAVAIIVGLVLGLSAAFTAASLPILRRPTLADRIGPYLRDQPRVASLYGAPAAPTTGLMGILHTTASSWGTWLASRITTDSSVLRRLQQLGGATTVERFRTRQVLCILAGLASGAVLGAVSAVTRGFSPVVLLGLIGLGAVIGHIVNDWWLTQQVRGRERRIMAEFPTVAEILALSMTAGEGTIDALERVCRSTTGELSQELTRALSQVRTGTPLVEALDAMGTRTGNPSIIRFVDGIAVATSRGTPLAEVLRAQAADVREHGRRSLMEVSGRKEVAMLIPVVAFVLPVTVLFAIYPTLAVLELGP
ncbi:type II secretion system F family protein [Brevibacterium yomogidense]|uniref:type II secretion system F family protein n=1 Tax=Brevibacterium yomogidense TaxID=946573 RepID=UPI00211B05BD|nr:type II secretion system F family protein [Brevibacterium yomogidense]